MVRWLRSLFGLSDIDPPVTLDSLQGTWLMVSLGKNGNFAPPHFIDKVKISMTIEGDQYSVVANGEPGDSGVIVLDESKCPIYFDQCIMAGADSGKVHLGIVRFRDGLLENCQADIGGRRPTDFARKRKDGASLACFRRQTAPVRKK